MEDEQLTTAPDPGSVPEGTSQESNSSSQEPVQNQESGTAPVEAAQQPTSSEPPERAVPPASDFYSERKQTREMRNMLLQQQKQIEEMSRLLKSSVAPPVQPKPLTYDDFIADPNKIFDERDNRLVNELMEKRLPQILEGYESKRKAEQDEREALNLMFPKSKDSPHDDLALRIKSTPQSIQRAEELQMIIEDYGFGSLPPLQQAKAAIEIYDGRKAQAKPRNPYAPTKSQMASTATGSGQGGKTVNPQEIQAKAEKMKEQMSERPELLFDQKFRQEWDLVKSELGKVSAKAA